MECAVCESKIEGDSNYCSNCGSPVHLPRISFQYIMYEVGSILSFRKGILFTIKELILRPGESTRRFIAIDRNYLVKPVIFTIFCSLLYTIAQELLHFEDVYYDQVYGDPEANADVVAIVDWIRQNYGYLNILSGIFIAFWLKIFFRKSGYNFFELLVFWLFMSGIAMLIYLVFGVVESLTGWQLYIYSTITAAIYTVWSIGRFYKKGGIWSYVKGLLAYIIGMFFFTFATGLIGVIIFVALNKV